jgi:hypothetical protein
MQKKRALVVVLTVATVGVLGTGAVVVVAHGRDANTTQSPPDPKVATVAIRKMDISDSRSFTGTLGHGGTQSFKGAGAGVVTKLPQVGDVAERGKPLYSVNGVPVPVFFGATPMFRKLDAPTLTGLDVAMVADNLVALGYRVGTRAKDPAKAAFTPELADAVKRWKIKAGLADTPTLDVGEIAVLAGPSRVAALSAQLGDPSAGPLFTITGTAKAISVPVEATDVGAIKTGVPVRIVRPDGKEVPGKVTAISSTANADDKSGTQGQPPKVDVTVLPDDEGAFADLESAPVAVKIATETHPGALVVPIGALVALREGGYALQLQDGRLKAVKTGMFAKDLVEITGDGLAEGMQVVTTS